MNFSRVINTGDIHGKSTRKVEFKTEEGEIILFPLENQDFLVRMVPTASLICYKCIKNIIFVYPYQRTDQTQFHGLEMSMLIDAPHQFSLVEFFKPEFITEYCKLETKEDTLGYLIHHRLSGFTGNKILFFNF